MPTLKTTPRQDGYRMPAEFEKHRRCWLLFPERPDNWREGAGPGQHEFVTLADALARFEDVTVGATSSVFARARALLPSSIPVIEVDYDDVWIRDTGPTYVVNDSGTVRGVHWGFNSWGGLFESWAKDEQVGERVLQIEGVDRYVGPLVLEGGALDVDGEGTLLITEESLFGRNRNPGLDRNDAEAVLKDYLNVQTVIWLPRGIHQDEAGGHIDNLCRFIRPGEVLLTWPTRAGDPQAEISQETLDRLESVRDARNRTLRVHRIAHPGPQKITSAESRGFRAARGRISRETGDLLSASYVNFAILNHGIVVPAFGDESDADAQTTLRALFPERTVVPVAARELLLGGGAVHCVVQQVPQGSEPVG